MTMKNTLITVGFAVIAATQFSVGMGVVTLAAERESKAKLGTRKDCLTQNIHGLHCGCAYAGQTLPPIPLDAYRLCIMARHRALEIAYTSVLLLFGASG